MNTRQAVMISLGLIALALLYSGVLYPHLPDPMPIHWNGRGEIDGWCPKWQGVLMMPGTMLLLLILLQVLPLLPLQNSSVEAFRPTYNYIMLICIAMTGYIHAVMLWAALHQEMDFLRVLMGGMYLFFAALGNVMGKLRPNRWAGVRTPWTMASEEVWVGTHRFAARLWTACGLIGAAAAWLGAPWRLTIGLLLPMLLLPVPYSYILYKQLGN